MPVYPTVLIPARISRGGFGNERTYKIRAAGGEFTGLASWQYCFDSNLQRVEEEPLGEVDGFVEARIVNGEPNGPAKVWLPDGEVCYVARADIKPGNQIPPRPETAPNAFV